MSSVGLKDVIDIAVAAGTVLAAIFAAAGLWYAGSALRAQTFLAMLNTARDIDFSERMDIIRQLRSYSAYEDFERNETAETQKSVRTVIDFLNDMTHLIRHRYIKQKHIANLYTPSILACKASLLNPGDWWVTGFRRKYEKEPFSRYYYENFRFLCENIEKLQTGEAVSWPTPH